LHHADKTNATLLLPRTTTTATKGGSSSIALLLEKKDIVSPSTTAVVGAPDDDFCQNLSGVLKSHIRIAPSPPLVSNTTTSSSSPSRRPSVLCFIMTHSKYHKKKVKNVAQTWGRKCDRLVIASNKADPSVVGSVRIHAPATWKGLWTKLQATTKYIWHHYPDYDWYLKADDDTYVIMENLKAFLVARTSTNVSSEDHDDHHPRQQPLLFGRRLRNPTPVGDWQTDPMWFGAADGNATSTTTNHHHYQNAAFGQRFRQRIPDHSTVVYTHGGPGYVMNRAYFELLTKALQSNDTVVGDPPEDMAHAAIMLYQGVLPQEDSLDDQGREYFHPESPDFMFRKPTSWLDEFSADQPMKEGLDCCAPYSISFHHISKMKRLEKILYECPR
jgi:glycoprotein-N-acetylgalactosamine 3-beta-galactosyltransferase